MINRQSKENILWGVLACAIALGLIWQFVRLPDGSERLARLPTQGPGYSSVNLPLNADEVATFSEINVIKRLYAVEGKKYFIYILDGTADRHVVHDPTYCFRGSGWEVTSHQVIPIEKGFAGVYHLSKGDQKKEAILWFSDGKIRYASPLRYWLTATLRRLTLGWSGQEPLLFVVQPVNEDSHWKKHLEDIVSILNI